MIICPWKDIKKYASLLPGIDEAVEAINGLNTYEPATYQLSDGNRFMVMGGTTIEPGMAEAHRKYLDIQYIVKGKEVMGWADLADCKPEGDFSEEKDIGFYSGDFEFITVNEGICYVVFPEDAHMPSRHLDVPNDYVKIVVKLKV